MTSAALRANTPASSRRESCFFTAIGAVICALLAFAPTYYVGLVAVAGVNAIACVGLALLLACGMLSLGHAAFLGLGAYGSALLAMRAGLPPVFSIPASVAICALLGYCLGKLTLQLKGHYLPLGTLAYGMVISVCFVAAIGVTGGASGLTDIPPLRIPGFQFEARGMAVLIWGVAALTVFGFRRIYRGRVGRVARALKSNRQMAASFGVDVPAVKTKIFVLSAALAGLAGSLYAFYMQFLSPASFSIGTSFNLLIMVVLGGVAHPLGAVLGVLFFTVLELAAQYLVATALGWPGQVETMLFGAVLILVLLRWPDGLLTWARLNGGYGHRAGVPVARATRARRKATPLSVAGITKRFGGLTALSSVTLTAKAATITGLIGPNGAGKSTLFNVMTGVYPATEGSVMLGEAALPRTQDKVVGFGVARTFQHVQLVQELDVTQNVLIGAYATGKAGLLSAAVGADREEERTMAERAAAVIERVGLGDVSASLVSSLPLGSQRLVEVARALMADPSAVLLDEPAAGLRTPEKRQLAALLRSLRDDDGMTVLLVEHDMELVMGCADELFVLNYGSLLAQGSPAEIQQNPAVVAAYLGGDL